MTALADLTDVGDLSGKADGDRLTYDLASSLWVPKPPPPVGGGFVHSQGTLTYPAGDNGWVYVDDATAAPYVQDHVENTAVLPAGDAAFLTEFTVTEAMLGVGGQAGLAFPYQRGLWVTIGGAGSLDANAAIDWAVVVDGVRLVADSWDQATNRLRFSWGAFVPCAAGDVIRLHAWARTGATNSIDWVFVAAATYVGLLNLFTASDDDNWVVQATPATLGFANVNTGPAGTDAVTTGSILNPSGFRWRRQTSPTAQTTDANSAWGGATFKVGSPDYDGLSGRLTARYDSTNAGGPLLTAAYRLTSHDFWTALVDAPVI